MEINQKQVGYLLMVCSNSGQHKPQDDLISQREVDWMVERDLIGYEVVRKKRYYYATAKGSQLANRLYNVFELTEYEI